MDAAGQVLGDIQLATHKSPVDGRFRGFVREAESLLGLALGPQGLEVLPQVVHPDCGDAHEAQVLGVLREYGRERAWDNVAKLAPSITNSHFSTAKIGLRYFLGGKILASSLRAVQSNTPFARLTRRNPLLVFFFLAYLFGWISFLPLVLTSIGAGGIRADGPIEFIVVCISSPISTAL